MEYSDEEKRMTERRVVTIDQLHNIKDQLDVLTEQVDEIDSKLSTHIDSNKIDMTQTQSSFVEVKAQLTEVKNKVDEIETSLPARIMIVENNLATIRDHQITITPKIDDIYDIISVWRGFSRAMGWISDNVKTILVIVSVVGALSTGGVYIVDYAKTRIKIVPAETTFVQP